MKVAQIVESAGGGTGRHVIDLCNGLAKRGHDVTLVYSEERIEKNFEEGLKSLTGVKTEIIEFRRAIGLHDVRHSLELAAVLKANGVFDIVHGHSSKAGALVRLLPRRVAGARIYSPHAIRTMDPTLTPAKRTFFAAIERLLALRSGHFIAGSLDEIAALEAIGVGKPRVTLLDFGIDPGPLVEPRDARRAFGLPDAGTLIGFVGRLDWQKAPERAIGAFARLGDPTARLVIVGEGKALAALSAEAASLGVTDRIDFLGFQNGQRIMPAFDVLLMPSRYESSPYVLLEALMANVPVLTTPIGMATTLVGEGGAGTLVQNSDDPAIWAKALEEQLLPERRMMARSAIKVLQSARSLDAMVRQVEAIYDKCRGKLYPGRRRASA